MSNPNLPDNEVNQPEIHHHTKINRTTVVRDDSNAMGGLIWGITLASIVGLGTAAIVMFNQRPTPQAPSKTTIIEKTNTEKVVPQTKAPDVNITMPNPAPAQAPPVNITMPNPAPAQAPNVNITMPNPAPAQAPPANMTAPSPSPEASPAQTKPAN